MGIERDKRKQGATIPNDEKESNIMNNYKKHVIPFGASDIASLVLRSHDKLEELQMGIDANYSAYIIDESVEIPSHYNLKHAFTSWLTVFDDEERVGNFYADEIRVYRAGDAGILIQLIGANEKTRNKYL